jgi:hypothetical protein
LGGWLELEKVFNQYWRDQYAPDADDEWNFCKSLGSRCASVTEHHYASYITTQDIDKMAKTDESFFECYRPLFYELKITVTNKDCK